MSALSTNFPPAKTRLALVQETEDAFGVALVEALRADGYAVAEYAGTETNREAQQRMGTAIKMGETDFTRSEAARGGKSYRPF